MIIQSSWGMVALTVPVSTFHRSAISVLGYRSLKDRPSGEKASALDLRLVGKGIKHCSCFNIPQCRLAIPISDSNLGAIG